MEIDNNKESRMELLGVSGLLMAGACALQHMLLAQYRWVWMMVLLLLIDLFVLISFRSFMKMKPSSGLLLIISSALLLVEQGVFFWWGGIFWLSVVLTVFTIVVVVIMYVMELHTYMQLLEIDRKKEIY